MLRRRPGVPGRGPSRPLRARRRRRRAQRPAAFRVAAAGGIMLLLSAGLAAIQLDLLAGLLAGLAVLPLSVAVYLRLLLAPPWTDAADGDSRGPARGRGDDGVPRCPSGLSPDFDWDRFEQQFRAYVARRKLERPGRE